MEPPLPTSTKKRFAVDFLFPHRSSRWNIKETKFNVLDTPGYTDFIGEVISAFRVVEGAIVLVDSVAGLEVGTEIAWNYCNQFKLPRFVLINKMERENANFTRRLRPFRNTPMSA